MPIYNNFEMFELLSSGIENARSKIREIKIWTKSRERKLFIQILKNHSEELVIRLKKANGLMRTKVRTMTYLSEYVKIKFIRPKEMKDLMNPSKEMSVKPSSDEYIVSFIMFIKFENVVSSLNKETDKFEIISVISEMMFSISLQIQAEEFIIAINMIDLKTNCFGESILEYVRCEIR